jgi:hypothetical protein
LQCGFDRSNFSFAMMRLVYVLVAAPARDALASTPCDVVGQPDISGLEASRRYQHAAI